MYKLGNTDRTTYRYYFSRQTFHMITKNVVHVDKALEEEM